MATAFQKNAFQTVPLAFQITVSVPGRSGLGGDDVPRRRQSPNARGFDKQADELRRSEEASVESTLREVYARLTGEDAAVSTLARVDAITRPLSAPQQKADAPLRIDWQRMAADSARAEALLRLYREEQALRAQIEDEDELLLMLQ